MKTRQLFRFIAMSLYFEMELCKSSEPSDRLTSGCAMDRRKDRLIMSGYAVCIGHTVFGLCWLQLNQCHKMTAY